MAYLKGIYKKCIYQNLDNLYLVGLIKIKENDIDESLNEKTITFTGNFSTINIEDTLILQGELVKHFKYGEQFNVTSYEQILPDDEHSIINFLASDMFPGIGETKAKRIFDILGDNTTEIILNEPERLAFIPTITKKNIDILHTKMLEYEENIDILLKLNEVGFSTRDSNILYKKHKQKVLEILENNIYDFINEDDNFNFVKIDRIAFRFNYLKDDFRRIKAGISYVIREINNTVGDTYLYYHEIKNFLDRALGINISEDAFDRNLLSLIDEGKVVNLDERYYLKEMYEAEVHISKRMVYLNNKKDLINKKIDLEIDALQNEEEIVYNESQLEAIKDAILKNLLIITGGPGTGKTTIIKAITKLYARIYKASRFEMEEEIALLAPTGRAAKRMMEAVNLPSQTIHRFLKWNKDQNKFGVNEHNKSKVKMVIIDEFSMVDTYLFDNLLKGLKYDTKIILVGDYHQLPSVGSGQLLKDLIESEKFNCIKLETLYRQRENSNIISFAHDINHGVFNDNYFNHDDDLTFIQTDNYNLMDKLSELCYAYKDYPYNKFQIMAPMYKTINGIDNLNMIVQNIFNPKDKYKEEITIGDIVYREGDKVIELVNMPDDNVYNGDIGIIDRIDTINKEITVDYDGNIVKYNRSFFKNFKLGYVISIHKSQGSEFGIVVMPLLLEYNRMLYRKLIYTGVTRAKTNLYLLGEVEAIKKAINTNLTLERKTSLLLMIDQMYEEVKINE